MRSALALLCSLTLLGAFSQLASAQTFLSQQDRDFSTVVPPPPADGSPAGLADLYTLLQLQKDCTPAQVARAKRVDSESPFSFAQPVLGDWFTARNLPRTAAIFAEVHREIDSVVNPAKRAAQRLRRYVRDSRVMPVVGQPGSDSYPSGHSANAAVLVAVFPEDSAAFQERVRETMWCRELGGVHYPTDTESGRLFGGAIAKKMLAAPSMIDALQEIRAEVANARKANTAGNPQASPAERSNPDQTVDR